MYFPSSSIFFNTYSEHCSLKISRWLYSWLVFLGENWPSCFDKVADFIIFASGHLGHFWFLFNYFMKTRFVKIFVARMLPKIFLSYIIGLLKKIFEWGKNLILLYAFPGFFRTLLSNPKILPNIIFSYRIIFQKMYHEKTFKNC